MHYVAVVRKAGSEFDVDFPDLPGCVVAGKTMLNVRRLAAEALAFHLEGMAADGRPIPPPRSLSAIRDDPECAGATTLILVACPPPARGSAAARDTPALFGEKNGVREGEGE